MIAYRAIINDMAGKLLMIGSPIGNLGDISERTISMLGQLDRLYCEDTRVTSKLLAKLGIAVQIKALSDDSPSRSWLKAIEYVLDGHNVGFITDAGMPGLSDPGRRLLKLAWEHNVPLTVLPGPTSVGSLIALCPFSCHQFSFLGFAPRKDGEITGFISQIAQCIHPVFFFESPKRVHGLLTRLCAGISQEREIIIGRELTKLHEQVILFSAEEWTQISKTIPAKGEFTIAVSANSDSPQRPEVEGIVDAINRLESAGFSKRDAAKAVAIVLKLSSNDVKKAVYQG